MKIKGGSCKPLHPARQSLRITPSPGIKHAAQPATRIIELKLEGLTPADISGRTAGDIEQEVLRPLRIDIPNGDPADFEADWSRPGRDDMSGKHPPNPFPKQAFKPGQRKYSIFQEHLPALGRGKNDWYIHHAPPQRVDIKRTASTPHTLSLSPKNCQFSSQVGFI